MRLVNIWLGVEYHMMGLTYSGVLSAEDISDSGGLGRVKIG